MVKMALSLPFHLQPMVGWARKPNNFIDESVNCYVKNQMLATVILVRGLNGKQVFSLLRTSIICVRGSRSKKYNILTNRDKSQIVL